MRFLVFSIVLGLTGVVLMTCFAAEPTSEPAGKSEPVMEAKLEYCRALMQALAMDDFTAISTNAYQLARVTRLAAWQRDDSPEYQADSVDFERDVYMLIEAAKKKDRHEATLAYVELSLTCVDCHEYMRTNKLIELSNVDVTAYEVDAKAGNPSIWMQHKLALSQDALDSLVKEDFVAMKTVAETMLSLSRIEGWVRRHGIEEYQTYVGVFDHACRELSRAADEKDLSRAKMAFAKLTLSCATCHEILRHPSSNTAVKPGGK